MNKLVWLLRCGAWSIFLICLTIGCGSGGFSPVTGKVTSGDKPLTKGSVTFHPDQAKGNESKKQPSATIDSDGKYMLFTDGDEGAPPGWYKVTIFAEEARKGEGESAYAAPTLLVREEYTKPETTPISIEVKDDAPAGHYDIELEPIK